LFAEVRGQVSAGESTFDFGPMFSIGAPSRAGTGIFGGAPIYPDNRDRPSLKGDQRRVSYQALPSNRGCAGKTYGVDPKHRFRSSALCHSNNG